MGSSSSSSKCEFPFKSIILRNEYRHEMRTPLTPSDARALMEHGITVFVEQSKNRIFTNEEYKEHGCVMVEPDFWIENSDTNCLIIGLKELPDYILDCIEAYKHNYNFMHFQHCLKQQIDSDKTLKQLSACKLFDFEYVKSVRDNIRLLTFGESAGFVGAALAIFKWIEKTAAINLFQNKPFESNEFVSLIKMYNLLNPSIIIIGANGRCGVGAQSLLRQSGITNVTLWDIEDTRIAGPYEDLLKYDIIINTILLNDDASTPSNVFLTTEMLKRKDKQLKIIVDVSCNVSSAKNVLPFCDRYTTFDEPFMELNGVSICTIDNLPSLMPLSSSVSFSSKLTQLILDYDPAIWQKCLDVFLAKIHSIQPMAEPSQFSTQTEALHPFVWLLNM